MTLSSVSNEGVVSPSNNSQPLPRSYKSRYHKSDKSVYGNSDSRLEPLSLANPQVQRQALSIACFVKATSLQKIGTETYELRSEPLKQQWKPLGKNERFRDQIIPGVGTAFLVELQGRRYFLTAAHMVCNRRTKKPDPHKYNKFRLVFDFQADHEGEIKTIYQKNEIYKISSVVKYAFAEGKKCADWALLEVNKEVTDRESLRCNFNHVRKETPLYMLGYPSGLPLKYAEGSITSRNRNGNFEADLDAFHGNSGSPVFNKETGEVCGILVQGNDDYIRVYDRHRREWRWAVRHITQAEIDQNGYEKVQGLGPIQRKSFKDRLRRLIVRLTGK